MAMNLQRLTVNDSVDDVVECTLRDGGVVIEGMIGQKTLDTFWRDITPILDAAEFLEVDDNPYLAPNRTKRILGLLDKTDAVCDIMLQPQLLGAAEAILGFNKRLAGDSEGKWPRAKPLLSLAGCAQIHPGEKAQLLHRDDMNWHPHHPADTEVSVQVFQAMSRFTAANGATMVIPGSHLWDDVRQPTIEEAIPVEMPAGSGLIYLGSLYHGGGANITRDEARTGISLTYIQGWLRQEENQFLAVSRERLERLPRQVQKLMGYAMSPPFCGYLNTEEPYMALRLPAGDVGVSDIPAEPSYTWHRED